MIFYCPACWREIPQVARDCPHCTIDVERLASARAYPAKLIAALDHPEPTTRVRAAWILGIRRERSAVARLTRLVLESEDPYLVEAAVEALGRIGDRAGLRAVAFAARHGGARVRERARQAIDLIEAAMPGPPDDPASERGV
jgi:HEAT repeat protein